MDADLEENENLAKKFWMRKEEFRGVVFGEKDFRVGLRE